MNESDIPTPTDLKLGVTMVNQLLLIKDSLENANKLLTEAVDLLKIIAKVKP